VAEPADLLAQSLAKLRTANRIDGSKNSYRKDSPAEYAKVIAYLDGGSRPTGVISDMGVGLMLEEDARRALEATPEPEPEPEPEPPVPPADYPASYFTGPLGLENVLPVDPNGALLCLWHSPQGGTAAQTRASIQQRMSDCGRAFDGLGIHGYTLDGRGGGHLGAGGELWVHQQGSIPLVSWTPGRLTRGGQNLNTMREINDGLHDDAFTKAANYWKDLGFRVMLRQFWEFDGNWFPWSPTANPKANDGFPNPGCTTAEWIQAWKRVVGLFQSAGATKVGFWFCPSEGFNRSIPTACYPGDAHVDWVGSDIYNQASATVWTSPLHIGWAEFWENLNYTGHGTSLVCKHDEFGPRKPFVVGETATLADSSNASRKANWYRNINDHANAKPDMPYLRGIQLFDVDLHSSEGFDWRVDSSQTYAQKVAHTQGAIDAATYQGFKDFAAHPDWNVGAIGGAS